MYSWQYVADPIPLQMEQLHLSINTLEAQRIGGGDRQYIRSGSICKPKSFLSKGKSFLIGEDEL
jgi:hypothetical protein